MMGVLEEMQPEFYRAAEAQIASQDPEFARSGQDAAATAVQAATTLHRLAAEMIAARRAAPAGDI